MNEKSTRIRRWALLCGRDPSDVSEPHDLAFLFQALRPNGDGLASVFEGLDHGDEIQQRVARCYEALGEDEASTTAAYFIPRTTTNVEARPCEELARRYTRSMHEFAKHVGETELVSILDGTRFERVEGVDDIRSALDEDSPQGWIQEIVVDRLLSIPVDPLGAAFLREAMYSIAADYMISSHLLWPIYRDSLPIEEPFEAYFELWLLGGSVAVVDDERTLFVCPTEPGR